MLQKIIKDLGMESSLLITLGLPLALATIMFTIGLALRLDNFKLILQQPKIFAVGLICQMIVLPIIGFAIISAFNLDPMFGAGFMILCLAPGGVTSNAFTHFAGGNTSLSVALTSTSSLLTPFTLPITATIFLSLNTDIELSFLKSFITLLVITIVPVGLGMLANKLLNSTQSIQKILNVISMLFLAVIVGLIVISNWTVISNSFSELFFATFVLCVLAYASGYFIPRFLGADQKDALTIGNEVGLQNGTTALLITGTILNVPAMSVPVSFYSLMMFAIGVIFCLIVKLRQKQPDLAPAS